MNAYTFPWPMNKRTAFDIGHQTVGFYEWSEQHPVQGKAFQDFMKEQFVSLPTWLDVINFESDFGRNTDSKTILFVDVGGENDQQCLALLGKYLHIQGDIVLQERPMVLAKASVPERVRKMEYDYVTEQPVKCMRRALSSFSPNQDRLTVTGARVYYFRQIFHNNYDAMCIKILRTHRPAMTPSSAIVIDDKALPDEIPAGSMTPYAASLSVAMPSTFNAIERRELNGKRFLMKLVSGLGLSRGLQALETRLSL